MNWIVSYAKWIMLVSGVLTCTMVYAAVAPKAALQSTFGETLEGPLAEIIVRNWAALIALIGGMLIYGAFNTAVRRLALVIAGASKIVFIALVLSQGGRYLAHQAGVAIVIDACGLCSSLAICGPPEAPPKIREPLCIQFLDAPHIRFSPAPAFALRASH